MSEAVLFAHMPSPSFKHRSLPCFLRPSYPTHPHRRFYLVATHPAALQCDGCCIPGYDCQEMSDNYSEVRHSEARES